MLNGALTDKSPWRTYTKYTIGGNTGDIDLSVSDLNVSGLIRGFMISAMNQNNVWVNETWFNTSYLDYNAKIFHLNNPSNFTLNNITVTIFYSDTY